MSDINIASISGRIVRDAELRGEGNVLSFTIASNRTRKDDKGNYVDYTTFIDCVIFGTRAKALESKLKKGLQVFVEGRLNYEAWEKDGAKHSKHSIVCDELVIGRVAAVKPA